ncbi:MAG: hypothetical protein ACLPVY_04245 [Acidimicrobiia bacterium]
MTRHWSGAALAECGAYALAIALVLGPGLVHAGTELIGHSDDARYYTWLGWRLGRLIAHGHLVPMRIPDVIAPFGLNLRLVDGYLPSYVSGLLNVVFGPFLSYNLTFVAGAVLNIVGARSLARRLSPYRLVHVIAAIAFLSAPPIALNVQVGLLPLYWAFTVPLLLGDAIDVVVGNRSVRPLRLAVLLVVAYLCSVYFLVFGGLAYGLIVGVAALRQRSWRIPITVAVAVAITLVVLSPFVVSRAQYDRAEKKRGADTELLSDSELFSADALSIFAQPTRSTLLLPRPAAVDRSLNRLVDPTHALESTIFPGLLLLVGFGLFLTARDRRRTPILVAAAAIWVLSLGPSLKFGGRFVWEHAGTPVSWLPYRLVLAVPSLGGLRAPLRTGYVLAALLTATTAIALDRVLSNRRVSATVVAVVSAVLLATNLLLPLPSDTMGTTAASERALREIGHLARPGDTVLRVPADCDPAFESYQIFHDTPVIGCAGSFAADPWSKLVPLAGSDALAKLRCDRTEYGRITTSERPTQPFGSQDLAQLRKEFGVRFVVVDRSMLGIGCPSVNGTLAFFDQFRSLGGDGRFEVLDLSARRRDP